MATLRLTAPLRQWVPLAVELAASLLLSSLVIVLLRPGLPEAASYGRHVAGGQPAAFGSSWLLYPPIVSAGALLFAMVLAVFKPWGRARDLA